MNLALYLWKEWRDQRAGLARLAFVLVLLAALAFLLPKPVAGDPIFVTSFVGVGGLSAAFASKLVLFAGSSFAAGLLGLVLALGVAVARTGELPPWSAGYVRLDVFLACAAVLVWTFAASTWVPRSALALPVTLAVLAFLGWPLWLVFGPAPWYAPSSEEVALYVGSCLVGAPLSAWASFAWGYRRGGGPRRALGAGLAVAALVLAPAWGWTALRAWSLWRFDPTDAHFRIANAVVGADERLLFLTGTYELPYRLRLDGEPAESPCFAVTVDLADGTWETRRNAEIAEDAGRIGFGLAAIPVRFATGAGALLDGRTGAPLSAMPRSPEPGFLPTAAELGPPPDEVVLSRRGQGYSVASGIFDPFRGRVFSQADVAGPDEDLNFHRVRAGHWVARDKRVAAEPKWVLLDPETGATSPIGGLREGEFVSDVLPDGRLVLGGVLLDPESGARTELAFAPVNGFGPALASSSEVRVLGPARDIDSLVFLVRASRVEGWTGIARLDPECGVLHAALGASGLVRYLGGSDAGDAYVVEDSARVVKVRFGTGEREVVFPRSAE